MKKYLLLLILLMVSFSTVSATILSIDRTEYVSNVEQLQGPAWLVIARGDKSPEYIIGGDGKDIEGEKDNSIVHAKYGFELKLDITKQSCDYKLFTTNEPPVVKYTKKDEGSTSMFFIRQYALDHCYNKYAKNDVGKAKPILLLKNKFPLQYYVECLEPANNGEPGGSSNYISFLAEVKLKKEGEAYTPYKIGSLKEAEDGKVLGDRGFIKWTGSAWSGESCPTIKESGLRAIHSQDTWIFAKDGEYIQYSAQLTNLLNKVTEDVTFGLASEYVKKYKDLVLTYSTLNTLADDIIINKDTFSFDNNNAVVTDSSTTQGQATIKLLDDHFILMPDFRLYLKADWLKIVIPVGKPKIVEAPKVEFKEGENKAIMEVKVKNVGEAEGEFGFTVTCDSPFSVAGSRITLKLDKGETDIATIPLTVDTNKKVCGECKVKVYDRNYPVNYDSRDVDVCATPITFCSKGDEQCMGEKLQVCNSEGQWVDKESDKCVHCGNNKCEIEFKENKDNCEEDCGAGGIKDCKPIFSIAGITILPNLSSECIGFFGTLKIVVLIIATLLTLLFSYGLLSKIENLEDKKGIVWIISLLISIAVGILIWVYFWIGVLIAIVWLFVSGLIGKFVGRARKSYKELRRGFR